MYEIHIKLRNVITEEEDSYRTISKYKSKGKAAKDIAKFIDMVADKSMLPVEKITASVVKVKK
ncbi:hypothetical protein DEN77_004598 [Escherichia coli]|uniref:hypothetical protein n=1 Tax=Escherichia coli TaxID=562 RepID=UPI000BB61E80|nr:hypothetical protein [Escherichia coli]EIH0397376.1 hypothetical protein [Escherichia coli]EIP7781374.1 hypothetical protein [Escherichia coli]PBS00153.1 hypothetical protein COD35_12910 [Escherichia coli]